MDSIRQVVTLAISTQMALSITDLAKTVTILRMTTSPNVTLEGLEAESDRLFEAAINKLKEIKPGKGSAKDAFKAVLLYLAEQL